MTSEGVALAEAFSRPVREAGLEVHEVPTEPPLAVRLHVVDPQNANHLVAVFEGATNDYIGVQLDNGAHFWEHDWDQPSRETVAACLGAAAAEHAANRGTYERGGRHYGVTVDEGRIRTRDPIDSSLKLEP